MALHAVTSIFPSHDSKINSKLVVHLARTMLKHGLDTTVTQGNAFVVTGHTKKIE